MSVIFIGPKLNPVTGQSLAFHNIVNNYGKEKLLIEYGGSTKFEQVISTLFGFFKMLLYLIFHRTNSVYITTSRSRLGFARDFIFIHLASLFSVKILNHLHGADFKDFYFSLSNFFRKIVYVTYCKISVSIVLLPKMKEQYDMFSSMKVIAIDNGCSPPSKHPDFERKIKNQILYLSNVMYSKGILFLIDAIDTLKNHDSNIKLIVAGNILGDDYMNEFEMSKIFFDKIKNKDYIEYVGPVSGVKKNKLLHESLYFALPSFYKTEAQPLSLIEAMLNGCICITTSHNYLSDMVSNKNGCIVREQNSNDISDFIISNTISEENQKEIYSFNLNYANNRFSLENHLKKIISLF
ncbi:glycosyltransferase family 4 protein [Photobacterium damselae]|uniref:glycosyltransferase family 4 protein n=1 Tax=Photobacterium damselae TaxID=38293 RepID=UPI0040682C47